MHVLLQPSFAAAVLTLVILSAVTVRAWRETRAHPQLTGWRWVTAALAALWVERAVRLGFSLTQELPQEMWHSLAWLVIAGLLAAGMARLSDVLRDLAATAHVLAGRVSDYEQLVEQLSSPLTIGEVIQDEACRPVDFRYVMVNEAAVKALGHEREELLTKTCRQLFPEVEASWFALYAKVVATGESVITESHTRGSDRHYQVVVFRPSPGKFAALTTDITDSRRAADTLRRSEERLRAALDDIDVAVIIADSLGHAVLLNRAATRLTGWSLTAGLGRRVSEVFRPVDSDTREVLPNHVRQVLADGQPVVLTKPPILISRDGTERRIKASILPVRLPDGTLLASVVVFDELPAAGAAPAPSLAAAPPPVAAPAPASAADAAYRQFAELCTEGLSVWQGERLQYANPAFATSVGSTTEELAGLEFAKLVEPQDYASAVAGLLGAASAAELPPRTEFQVATPGGLSRTLRCRWGRVQWQGQSAVLAITSEVVPKGTVAGLARSRVFAPAGSSSSGTGNHRSPALAPAPAPGGLTMARLTHDLNNHLCGIQGFAELLANNLEDAEQKEHAESIVQSVHRAVDLVRQAQSGTRSVVEPPVPPREFSTPAVRPPAPPPPAPPPSALSLPKPAAPASVSSVQRASLATGFGARVLLVDDDPVVREVGAQVLRRAHFQVTTCADGQAALDYYTHHWEEVDVVMLDLLMPNLDGRETLTAMRRLNPRVRALFATGMGGGDNSEPVLIDGALGMVSKPFSAADLTRAISTALAVDMVE